MSRFFPPALTAERKGEIIVFKQGEESLHYMGGVQEIAKEVPYAWDRSDNSDGHFL